MHRDKVPTHPDESTLLHPLPLNQKINKPIFQHLQLNTETSDQPDIYTLQYCSTNDQPKPLTMATLVPRIIENEDLLPLKQRKEPSDLPDLCCGRRLEIPTRSHQSCSHDLRNQRRRRRHPMASSAVRKR